MKINPNKEKKVEKTKYLLLFTLFKVLKFHLISLFLKSKELYVIRR